GWGSPRGGALLAERSGATPRDRSEPTKRRARARVGESEGRSPSVDRRSHMSETLCPRVARAGILAAVLILQAVVGAPAALAAPQATDAGAVQQAAPHRGGGEANLILPDLGSVSFQGVNSRTLLMGGLGVCVLGL